MEIIRFLSEEEMLAVAGGFLDPDEIICITPAPPITSYYPITPTSYGSLIVSTTYGSSGSTATSATTTSNYNYSNSSTPHSF